MTPFRFLERPKPEPEPEPSKRGVMLDTNILEVILGLQRYVDIHIDVPYVTKFEPKPEALEAMVKVFGKQVLKLLTNCRVMNEVELRDAVSRAAGAMDSIVEYLHTLGYEFEAPEENK